MTEYPWLDGVLRRLLQSGDTLHHGLLITGIEGIAKRELALELARSLLCNDATGEGGCGKCQNCRLFLAGTHPDFHVVTTELETATDRTALLAPYSDRYQDLDARNRRAKPGRVIPVDQVRLLIERFCGSAHISARKVALIVPADRMNANAANALLKLLEEPPADSVLILVTAAPWYLPATVRSRCMHIAVPAPDAAMTREWLEAKTGSDRVETDKVGPLKLQAMSESGYFEQRGQVMQAIAALAAGRMDPLEFAAMLSKLEFLPALELLHRFSSESIRRNCAAIEGDAGIAEGIDFTNLHVDKLFDLYDRIGQYRKIAREQLNEQLALEELALRLQHAVKA